MARKKKRKKTAIFLLFLIICSIAWLGSVWTRIYDKSMPDEELRDGSVITNVLILGLDQRDDEPARADTIIVMSINKETGGVALVSIPRDSRVEIPGRGLDKMNHAMQYGGVKLLRQTVENLLSVPIHHYVYTNFAGFENIIDALGGIEVDVERQISGQDGQPVLNPGLQHVNGMQALTYVRFRSDAEGDFGRMRRQQQVLKAIAEKTMQADSIVRLPSLLEQFARHVRTDMLPPQLLTFSRTVATLDLSQVPTIQLKGSVATIDGISYVLLDQAFLLETVRRYLRWESPTFSNDYAV